MPEIEPVATTYTVSALPMTSEAFFTFAITVELTHHTGLWAVRRHRMCLGSTGTWDWEPLPSSREDDWLAAHRFDLNTALRLAVEAAPAVTVNSYTAADARAFPSKES